MTCYQLSQSDAPGLYSDNVHQIVTGSFIASRDPVIDRRCRRAIHPNGQCGGQSLTPLLIKNPFYHSY